MLRPASRREKAPAHRPLRAITREIGHASLDSTRIYTLPTDDDLDAAIARVTADR